MKTSLISFSLSITVLVKRVSVGRAVGFQSDEDQHGTHAETNSVVSPKDGKSRESRGLRGSEGDVQLIMDGRASSKQGLLHVYHDGMWGSVCDDDFTNINANVVCRQLGHTGGYAVGKAAFGHGKGPVWLDDVNCTGTEEQLVDCKNNGWGEGNCGHDEDVGVVCLDKSFEDGDVQLADGRGANEGRLQIYHDGVWGTVCDDDFTNAAANVVCRQLGYQGGYGSSYSPYARGVDPTWLDEVVCSGSEASLSACSNDGWGEENCGHDEDVGIFCHSATFEEGDVQLVNGRGANEGRLQIYHDGVWGTVCDDEFTNAAANVVCRQLGYQGGYGSSYSPYGRGVDPTWLDEVVCSGSEASLSACSNDGWGEENCGHDENVGIFCHSATFEEGDVQLVNGTGPHEGRLQIYHDGVWGTVCDDDFTNAAANVVCRQLGYQGGYGSSYSPYGRGVDPTWLDEVVCSGSEASLSACSNDGWGEENCGHDEDVGIFCHSATFEEGDVQLVNGTGPHEGRLQIYHDGVWGTVCDDDFTHKSANVVCRQLGYQGGFFFGAEDQLKFGKGIDPTWLDGVDCAGDETSLSACSNRGWGEENCGHSEDVGISCFPVNSATDFSDGDIVLAQEKWAYEGLVLVYNDGHWGGICDDSAFTQSTVDVICNELGYSGGTKKEAAFGKAVEKFPFSDVNCVGNELRLSDCQNAVLGDFTCNSRAAGVSCFPNDFISPEIPFDGGSSGSFSNFHRQISWSIVAFCQMLSVML